MSLLLLGSLDVLYVKGSLSSNYMSVSRVFGLEYFERFMGPEKLIYGLNRRTKAVAAAVFMLVVVLCVQPPHTFSLLSVTLINLCVPQQACVLCLNQNDSA